MDRPDGGAAQDFSQAHGDNQELSGKLQSAREFIEQSRTNLAAASGAIQKLGETLARAANVSERQSGLEERIADLEIPESPERSLASGGRDFVGERESIYSGAGDRGEGETVPRPDTKDSAGITGRKLSQDLIEQNRKVQPQASNRKTQISQKSSGLER